MLYYYKNNFTKMNPQICLQEDNDEREYHIEASIYGDIKEVSQQQNNQKQNTESASNIQEENVQDKKGKSRKKKCEKKNRRKNKVNLTKKKIKNYSYNEITLVKNNFIGKKRTIKKRFSYYFLKKSKNKLKFNSDNNNTPININGSTNSSIIHLCQNNLDDTGQKKKFVNENLNELFIPKDNEYDCCNFNDIANIEYNQDCKILTWLPFDKK